MSRILEQEAIKEQCSKLALELQIVSKLKTIHANHLIKGNFYQARKLEKFAKQTYGVTL